MRIKLDENLSRHVKALGPLAVNQFIEGFAKREDLEDFAEALVIVEPYRLRIRRSERPAGEKSQPGGD